MSKMKPSAAFDMFNVISRDWPLNPRHVLRVSNMLNLIDYVPTLLRSKNSRDAMAGMDLAGSLIACYVVTNRWRQVVETLDFIGRLDDKFEDTNVAHWATTEKWQFSKKFGIPVKWRPQILAALEGPFFRQHIDESLRTKLVEIEKQYPDEDVVDATKSYKSRRKLNVTFDMISEFNKVIPKDPAGCSHLAVQLDMVSWVPKLMESRYRMDILAGCFTLGVLVTAHASAGEWERLLNLFERIGSVEDRFNHEFVYFEATSLLACYKHSSVLQHIPQKHHQRLRGALELPFFQKHFDPDQYEIEVRARDLQKTPG